MSRRRIPIAVVLVLGAVPGCGRDEGAGELHAQRKLLEREVAGLREAVSKLERGEAILPDEALVVTLSEGLASEFLAAQLPFEAEIEGYRVRLSRAAASFRGSPAVALTGEIAPQGHPDVVGVVRALGALEEIRIDPRSGTLSGRVAVDHIDLMEMAGLAKFLGGDAVDELARRLRKQLEGRIPRVEIPVRIEPVIELPAVTAGPVRIQAARMPLDVSVAGVFAGQGVLWVAVRVAPGELVKVAEAQP